MTSSRSKRERADTVGLGHDRVAGGSGFYPRQTASRMSPAMVDAFLGEIDSLAARVRRGGVGRVPEIAVATRTETIRGHLIEYTHRDGLVVVQLAFGEAACVHVDDILSLSVQLLPDGA